MSRNLGQGDCRFCGGHVAHVEKVRPITRDDCGRYYDDRPSCAGYHGLLVANAQCVDCEAKYLAWCDARGTSWSWRRDVSEPGQHFDLSFRSTFNDEPGPDDLPAFKVEVRRVRISTWPTCTRCGLRIYSAYGCECEEPQEAVGFDVPPIPTADGRPLCGFCNGRGVFPAPATR